MSNEILWSVYKCGDDPAAATSGLLDYEVMRLIYRSDGWNYSVKPEMFEYYDECSVSMGGYEITQLFTSTGAACWLACRFRDERPYKQTCTAFLSFELDAAAAEIEWLKGRFIYRDYDESTWWVGTDEVLQSN